MKTCYWLLPSLPVLCLAVSVPRANDEDVTIRLPNGWYFESNNSAASSTSAAIVLLPSDGDPVQLGSRIMLLRESGTIYVDVPGHVGLGGFSPDGDLLLAYHTSRDGTRVALYSGTTGARLWTKEYACRQFRFSASGKVISPPRSLKEATAPKKSTHERSRFSTDDAG